MATPRIPVTVDISSAIDGVRNIQSLNRELRDLRRGTERPLPDPTRNLQAGIKRTRQLASEVQGAIAQAFAAGTIVQAVRTSIQAFNEAQRALLGLRGAAEFAGEGFDEANAAAEQLARDGLGNVSQASRSLQTLISAGFGLDEAIELLRALGDAAAFGRTNLQSVGEAVFQATRGIKDNNSALVDNVGLTRNLSNILLEYAGNLGKTVEQLTEAERLEGIRLGVLEETRGQTGDLARLQGTLAGQSEQLTNRLRELAAEFGEAISPALRGVVVIVESFLPLFRRWIQLWQIVGTVAAAAGRTIAVVTEAVVNRDLAGLQAGIAATVQAARAQIQDIIDNPPGIEPPETVAANPERRAERRRELEAETPQARRAREKAAARVAKARTAATRKAERERLKAARLAAREEEQIEEALARARIEIAESTGTLTAAARRNAIAREFEDVRALLEARGDQAGIALIESLINVRAAEAQFDQLEAVLSRNLTQIQQRQAVIRTQQAAGLLTESQARQQIIALQQESRGELERTIPLLEEAAQALGPEAAADVARWRSELERTSVVVNDVALRVRGEFGNAMTQFFTDLGEGTKTAGEAFRSFAQTVLSSIQRILAERFTEQLLGSLLGSVGGAAGGAGAGGGILSSLFGGGFAAGGHVSGPGTGTSDSIPARLSAGEYVVRAAAVSQLGTGFLDSINRLGRGMSTPLRFAEGGAVPAAAAGAAAGGGSGVRVVNVLDPELARDFVESSQGERSILNIIERNRGTVQQMLR